MLTFQEKNHEYRWDDIVVPSVTHILSSVGVKKIDANGQEHWNSITGAEFMPDDERYSIFGNEFHKFCAYYMKGKDCTYDIALEPWIKGFFKWVRDWGEEFTPIYDLIEKPLYSQRYGYAGTMDLPAYDKKGRVWVIDWKTSVSKAKHWDWQLAGYTQLLQEELGVRARKGMMNTMSVRVKENSYTPSICKGAVVKGNFNKFNSIYNVFKMV